MNSGQNRTEQALHTTTAAINLGRAVRNWNDAPANPIMGSSGGSPVGGQVLGGAGAGEAAGAVAGAGEAAGAAGGLAELAPLALAAL